MWLKKKSVLQAEHHYDTEISADGTTDLRTTSKDYTNTSSSITTSGLPSAADAGNYFYLPTSGQYSLGHLYLIGDLGLHWSSSAAPEGSDEAYLLGFFGSCIYVKASTCLGGLRVGGLE